MCAMEPMTMSLWLVMAAVVLGVGTAATVWAIRTPADRDPRRPVAAGPDAALQALRQRYAAGEMDREEYLQRKVDLEP